MTENIEVIQELVVVTNQAGLAEEKSKQLIASFGQFFAEAREVVKEAKQIKVTEVSQIDEMAKAREVRLELQRIRTKGVEPLRVKLKEQSWREGKAIDGMANIIKALIVPAENYLKEQEDFVKNLEIAKRAKIEAERIAQLSKYVEDVSFFNLHPENLSDEAFNKLLENSRFAFEARQQAEKQAEKERIKSEEKEKTLSERALKIAPFTSFYPSWFNLTLETTQDEFNKGFAEAKAGFEKKEAENEKIRLENEKIRLENQKLAKEKAEAEARFKKEQEKIAEQKRKEEAQKRASEEVERKKLLAPDKEKLIELMSFLQSIKYPAVKSKQAMSILLQVEERVLNTADWLNEEVKKL